MHTNHGITKTYVGRDLLWKYRTSDLLSFQTTNFELNKEKLYYSLVVFLSPWQSKLHCWSLSQWAHNVKMTSYQRRCDVITSHRRWYDVILMMCACWAVFRRQICSLTTDGSGNLSLRSLDCITNIVSQHWHMLYFIVCIRSDKPEKTV